MNGFWGVGSDLIGADVGRAEEPDRDRARREQVIVDLPRGFSLTIEPEPARRDATMMLLLWKGNEVVGKVYAPSRPSDATLGRLAQSMMRVFSAQVFWGVEPDPKRVPTSFREWAEAIELDRFIDELLDGTVYTMSSSRVSDHVVCIFGCPFQPPEGYNGVRLTWEGTELMPPPPKQIDQSRRRRAVAVVSEVPTAVVRQRRLGVM